MNQQCKKVGAAEGGAGPCDDCTGSGMACCAEQCVDVSTNPLHCNGCNKRCPGTVCADFECQNPPACLPGFLNCDHNVITGCEVEAGACPPPTDAGVD